MIKTISQYVLDAGIFVVMFKVLFGLINPGVFRRHGVDINKARYDSYYMSGLDAKTKAVTFFHSLFWALLVALFSAALVYKIDGWLWK